MRFLLLLIIVEAVNFIDTTNSIKMRYRGNKLPIHVDATLDYYGGRVLAHPKIAVIFGVVEVMLVLLMI